jgi:selenocysteine lyase/cysteine desulfurase
MNLPEAYLAEFSEGFGYMDFAGTGPPSRRVVTTVADTYRRVANAGEPVSRWVLGAYEAALGTVARFLGVSPEQVTAVPTTSAGLFQVAFGLLGAGGNVVVPAREFPANLYPWLRAEAVGGPEVRTVEVPDGRVTAAALSAAVDDETRAVAVSMVDYLTGYRVDLGELRELAGDALLVVDGMQGLGMLAQGLAPADVVVGGGVKWLRAGWGSGAIAASPAALDRLAPNLTGWFGVEDFLGLTTPAPHPARADAERLREGSPAVYGALAYAAAIDVLDIAGIAAVERAVLDLAEALEEVLVAAGAAILCPSRSRAERSGIVSFRLSTETAAATAARLGEAGLAVGHHEPWVRLSPHATTDPDVVGAVAEAIAPRG